MLPPAGAAATQPSVGRRLAAFGLDYVLVVGYIAVLASVVFLAWRSAGFEAGLPSVSPWIGDLIAFVTLVLPVTLYFSVGEASLSGATWGKRRLSIRLQTVGAGPLTLRRSLLRSATKFVPWQISHTCLFHVPGWPMAPEAPPRWVIVGLTLALLLAGMYVLGMISRRRRTLYDLVAGTEVVLAR